MAAALLAVDMDGTLLRSDGSVDARDERAIRRAIGAGLRVCIATGRMTGGTLPTARRLGLGEPHICADGAILVCGSTGERLDSRVMSTELVETLLHGLAAHRLVRFAFMDHLIVGDREGARFVSYMETWTGRVELFEDVAREDGWRRADAVSATAAIGPKSDVAHAHATIAESHAGSVDAVMFPTSRDAETWAMLVRPRGTNKGSALERLAGRFGIDRANVAAIGDWHNDITMLQWAGASFAMGQAPPTVKAAATHALRATSSTGGGVAEAIERLGF